MSLRPERKDRPLPGAAVLAALLVLATVGCSGMRKGAVPPPPPEAAMGPAADNAAATAEIIPPAIPVVEEAPPASKAETPAVPPRMPPSQQPEVEAASPAKPQAESREPAAAPRESARIAEMEEVRVPKKPVSRAHPESPSTRKPKVGEATRVEAPVGTGEAESAVPAWARDRESLSYRVDFIGITMGYAWFRYRGKVTILGKEAYHLNVRAWTSGILSYIYPINEMIDYYLDTKTIEPIRVEYTGRKNKEDEVAIYDQKKGKIVYRYRRTGEIRKEVDILPGTHDPVSVSYYFRARGYDDPKDERNMYGGRKMYQISPLLLGKELLRTDRGLINTLVVRPVIRRDGKPDDKGDLKMWVSSDEMHVPIRIYAKFRKIREWTLVGELLPEKEGG